MVLDPGLVVSVRTLAALLDVTEVYARQKLVAEGVVKKHPNGGYLLFDSSRGYVRRLRDDNKNRAKTASQTRVQELRARELELKLAREDGRLVETEEAWQFHSQTTADFLQELDALAVNFARRHPAFMLRSQAPVNLPALIHSALVCGKRAGDRRSRLRWLWGIWGWECRSGSR